MATLGVIETQGDELSQLVASGVHEQKPITLANGAGALSRGTVLGMVTADYEYKQLDPDGVDGTEVARCILLEDGDATSQAISCEAFFMGKYRLTDLIWPDGITDAEKNAAILQLQDRGIIIDEDFV